MSSDCKAYTLSAAYYDAIYRDGSRIDYNKSVQEFLKLYEDVCQEKLGSLLDYGCGTGTHAVMFAKQDVKVTGIDPSSDQIILAKEKARTSGLEDHLQFLIGDMVDFKSDQLFDAAGAFFSPFCYLLSDEAVINFLHSAENIVRPNGLLFFEFWHILGFDTRRTQSYLVTKDQDTTIYRFNTPILDVETGVIDMPMEHLVVRDKTVLDEFTEDHKLRAYTVPHIISLVNQTSWRLVEIFGRSYDLPSDERKPKYDDFRLYAILQRPG